MQNEIGFTRDKNMFIKMVRDAICKGCGMNPLVGSGVSSDSGIIMGLEFSDYLAFVVQQSTLKEKAWNLRKNGWPSYPNTQTYEKVRIWTFQEFKRFTKSNTGLEVIDDGKRIRRISPVINSFDHLNFPNPPANIRSPDFAPYDSSIAQMNMLLRRGTRKADSYVPLWLKPEQSPTSSDWIREIGVRSLSDWRSTLRFLSRLKQDASGRVILSKPDGSIIDRFNTFITADRQPNLGHKMLAALARPLRMRTILTTNFDTLLEEAFLQSGHYLRKFFVSRLGRLPDPFLVRAQPSIVKIHGELLETRADFSLDSDPSIYDKRRFFRYFVDIKNGREKFQSMMSHVLVLGYSGYDIRTIRMLQYLLDESAHFKPNNQPKIFWICVTEGDVWRVNTYFQRYPKDRIIICRTDRPDLLLLELYQKAALAIPVAGRTYEYNHNVPPRQPDEGPFESYRRSSSQSIHDSGVESFDQLDVSVPSSIKAARDGLAQVASDNIFNRFRGITPSVDRTHPMYDLFKVRNVDDLIKDFNSKNDVDFWSHVSKAIKHKDQVIFFESACSSIEALSLLQSRLSSSDGKRCMWFELADYINSDALLRDVLRTIALRTGRFQREQVILHPLNTALTSIQNLQQEQAITTADMLAEHFTSLCRIYNLTPADWPILIYGRDLAGSCVGWQSTAWEKDTWDQLFVLIGALAMSGFPVLLAHSSSERIQGENDKWDIALKLTGPPLTVGPDNEIESSNNYIHFIKTNDNVDPPNLFTQNARRETRLSVFESTLNTVFRRCLRDRNFRKFVYAVCQFRQSRRPSALFYEAVQPCSFRFNRNGIDNDVLRARNAEESIHYLESHRVFYTKAGGTSWMHRDIRVALKMMLDITPLEQDRMNPASDIQRHYHSVGRTHFWIGDWYEKAFLSTGFSKPLFEALHHYFQAARSAQFAQPKGLMNFDENALRPHRFLLMRSAINAMTKALLVGRPYLKLWMANCHGFPMFDLGNDAPTSNANDNDYEKLIKWLYPKEHLKPSHLNFSRAQKKELSRCYQMFGSVISETQRSIRNESDLQISPDIASVKINDLFSSEVNIRDQLDKVFNSVYRSRSEWNAVTSQLHNLVLERVVHSSENDISQAYLTCLPIGDAPAFVTEDQHAISKGIAIATLSPTFDKLPPLIAIIESIAYAQLRRAKFFGHTFSDELDDRDWQRIDVRDEWLRLTRICNLGIDWCKHLPPNSLRLDLESRIRLHSYYGVGLANLDRFHESHRHLTEALAIQSKHIWTTPRVDQAKLSLRRAEVILTEAHRVSCVLRLLAKNGLILEGSAMKDVTVHQMIRTLQEQGIYQKIEALNSATPKESTTFLNVEMHQSIRACLSIGDTDPTIVVENLRRLLASMLDDAWFCIESAEKSLSGHSQSSLWWGRISLMKLRACGYQLNLWVKSTGYTGEGKTPKTGLSNPTLKMLAYRHRIINPQYIWQVYEAAFLNTIHSSANDKYRECRLVRYVSDCLQVFIHCEDEIDFVNQKCKDLLDRCPSTTEISNPETRSSENNNIIKITQNAVRKVCDLLNIDAQM
jgi:hypothetical protein